MPYLGRDDSGSKNASKQVIHSKEELPGTATIISCSKTYQYVTELPKITDSQNTEEEACNHCIK